MKRFYAILLAAALLLALIPAVGAAGQQVVYVDGTRSSSGDGASAATAVNRL